MTKLIGIGSKIPVAISVDGSTLGDQTLSDVAFLVKFYSKERRDSDVTHIYERTKAQCTPDPDDQNRYYAICDTTDLDPGALAAQLEVTYTDSATGTEVKENIILMSNVVLVRNVKPVDEIPVSLSMEPAISVSTNNHDGEIYRSGLIYVPKDHTLRITPKSPVPFSALTGLMDNNGNAVQFTSYGPNAATYVATANKFIALVGSGASAYFNVAIEDGNGNTLPLIKNGEDKTLTASITGGGSGNKLVFSSSNDSVIDVNSRGVLTSVGTNPRLPSVTIIALVMDSNYSRVLGKTNIEVYNAYVN